MITRDPQEFRRDTPERLRLGPPRHPLTWSFHSPQPNLGKLTQGPAVMIDRPPPPAAPKSGPGSNRLCHSKVAGQDTACKVVERAFTTLHRPKTQDKRQRLSTVGALATRLRRTGAHQSLRTRRCDSCRVDVAPLSRYDEAVRSVIAPNETVAPKGTPKV